MGGPVRAVGVRTKTQRSKAHVTISQRVDSNIYPRSRPETKIFLKSSPPAPLESALLPLCRVACAELAANRGYGRRGDREYRPIEALVWDTGGLPQSKPLGNSGGPTVRPCLLSVLSLTGEWIGKWIGDVVGRVIAGHASGNRACGRVDVVPAMLDR